jgi:hypothetical protein
VAIGRKEKMLLHIYRDAARVKELEYRQILIACSGVESSADPLFDGIHFRAAMARLEALLFVRAADGLVPRPSGRFFRRDTFWRDEARKVDPPGRITSAQMARITTLWNALAGQLGDKWTVPYFAAIVARATGKHNVGATALTNGEARNVIDALQDKLKHSLAQAHA